MENVLKFNVVVNTASGLASINGLNSAVGGVGTTAIKTGNSLSQAFSNDIIASVSHLTNIYGTLSGAISKATSTVGDFIAASNQSKLALAGLGEVSKAYGQSVEQANQYAKELTSDGLMKLSSSAQSLKFLMSSGFNITEAMQLATAMKDIGAFNNVVGNLDQAVIDASKGLKTGSMELIENIGLTQRLSGVMKAANIDITNGIDITNNAAQRQALFNAIMAEGNKFQGNAAKLALENSGAYNQLENSTTKLKSAIGDVLNVGFVPLAKITTVIANNLTKDLIPLTIAVAGGLTLYMIPAIISTTSALYAQAVALNMATGGLSTLAMITGGVIAGVVGVHLATMNSTESLKENNKEVKIATDYAKELLTAKENLNKQIESSENALTKLLSKNEDERITKARENRRNDLEEIEKASQAVYRSNLSGLETKQKIDKLEQLEQQANQRYLDAIEFVNKEKNKKNSDLKAKDLKTYYETVKFEDVGYYDWKTDQIKKEVGALKVSQDQKLALEKKYMTELNAELGKSIKFKPRDVQLRTIETTQMQIEAPPLKENSAKSKDEYLNNLKEMQKAGTVFTKTEQEIFDDAFEYVRGYTTSTGQAIDGYYRKRVEEAKKADSEMIKNAKAISMSALSGMQSEIDAIFNYKRKRTNEEYALDKKDADLNYKQSVKRIDEELKAEKKGSDKYEKLMLEKQRLDIDFAKANKERKDQEELDNMSGMDRLGAVFKAAAKSAIQTTASTAAVKAFDGALAYFPGPPGWIIAPIAAATTYAAVSAFGGMFANGGEVETGVLKGNSHGRGGIWINAEGGEHITKKSRVSELGVPFFDFINSAPVSDVRKMMSTVNIPSYKSKPRMVMAEGGLVNRGLPVMASGISENKLDRMISLLETGNTINYKKKTSVSVAVDPLTGETVYSQNLKGQKTVSRKRVLL